MNLPTIEVTEEEATAKLAEYERMLVEDRTAEDEAIAQAYRAAKRGLSVIRLTEAIKLGGYFEDTGLPRIAIAGATWTECVARWTGGDLLFGPENWPDNRGALVGRNTVRVPMRDELPQTRGYRPGRAPVPLVPPRHRPRPRRLRNCHVLWEVDVWDKVPAKDPALLRHIRGDLWAVLAVWDLTELERAILAQR
jgi:hypothetical protein